MSEISDEDLGQLEGLHRVLGSVLDWVAERDQIRDALDVHDDVTTAAAVEKFIEDHEKLTAELQSLARGAEDDADTNLQSIEEMLDDAAEMVQLLDPLLGGYSAEDDVNTITLRAIVDRLSRKLIGR